jgi:uncharacterized protein YdaU (DUF1376 family)
VAEKGRPWMRWHVTRWRNSPHVLQMSLAAQGAYRNLLDAAWQQGCRLPNIPGLLWKYALAQSPEEFAALAPEVLPMFTVSDDGQWLTNETLTEECAGRVEFAEELSRKRSEAGRKGNAARWGSTAAQGTPARESHECPRGCGELAERTYACEQCGFEGCVACLSAHERQEHSRPPSQTSQNASQTGSQNPSQTGSQNPSQNDRKNIAKPDLRSPKLLTASELIANASHKREEKRREEKKVEETTREPTAGNSDRGRRRVY